MKVLGVILARGGSKGVPGKNIRPLNGKPLITYAIEAAKQSKLLNKFIISTDDNEIAKIAKENGAEAPFKRPAKLATDTAHTPDVILHAVEFLEKQGEKYDLVVTLQPTSPLRNEKHIDEGIRKAIDTGVDSVVSVKDAFPPWWLWKMDGEKASLVLDHEENPFNLERQQLPKTYQSNGAIYVTKVNFLKKTISLVNPENSSLIIMDEISSLDIDTEIDFIIIENMLKNQKRGDER